MGYKVILGVDEAGYGPNLGPLTMAATIWRVPVAMGEAEVLECFSSTFKPRPWRANCQHLPLGDSKQLYSPSTGLQSLEVGLLALLQLTGCRPRNLAELIERVASLPLDNSLPPWYRGLDNLPTPQSPVEAGELDRLSALANGALAKSQITLLGMRAVIVPARSFNAQLGTLHSKGFLLSQNTLQLVAENLQYDEPAEIYCDRQGGRKNYLPLLADALPEEWFQETAISNARCSYRNSRQPQRNIHFSVRGDTFPPTALASMLAKYLRERFMHAFNQFWQSHLPQLKPTAGYPLDAKRFRAAIESTAARLQLPVSDWWREK
ncbi:hypothetical protein [Aureliella helgolandensis]|uniref:Uncharacterized protein n=1 Tax=Aureliella helgolandensis TaxID=2527968 RepID=A0A518G0D2_9BACT|nr:hypothetical protein [Aureliella helgolandensis]QDV22067.1 Hypothetical protein Q31a_03460 [Aureliella helgolandensis]